MRKGTAKMTGDLARRLRYEPKTAEEWAGRARMAEARQVAGVPLDEIDAEALRKAGAHA